MTSHATRTEGPDGSDPIPAIHDHELRIQKLEEILSFRAGNSIGKTRLMGQQMEAMLAGQTESPLKESDVLWNPSKTWKGMFSAPTEPSPGSDQDHPPLGYLLEPVGGKRAPGYVWWCTTTERWQSAQMDMIGKTVCPSVVVANPIPANEGDSQKAGLSDKIAESVVQDLQQACYDRDELRATVERLTSELDTTKRLLAESLVERDRLKNLHDARKVRIDGFREFLREHLGDLV